MTSSEEPTVLVVEDETFVRMIAADALAESGFQVLEAPDAMEALALLDKHDVAVVFTDINMPGPIDGLELADIVSTQFPHVKVIVTSGKQWLEPEQLPDDSLFLPKPYRPNQLAKLVGQQAGRAA